MKFYEVQKALEEGKKVRRNGMPNNQCILLVSFITMDNTKCTYIRTTTGNIGSDKLYHFTYGDLIAEDWEIVEDIQKVENNTSEIIADLQDQINYLKKEVNILKANVQNDTKKRLFLDTKRGVGIRD